MAEGILLIIVAGIGLLSATTWLLHVLRFYAYRAILSFFRLEKATRSLTPEQTKAAHVALHYIEQTREKNGQIRRASRVR